MGNIVPELAHIPAAHPRCRNFYSRMPDLAITPLDDLAVLSVRGTDARSFLQGQISNDVDLLDARPALLAGLHNAQGRCLAVLHLLQAGPEQILLSMPADLAAQVAAHLSRFVFRARVRIENASSQWRIYGAAGPDAEAAARTRLSVPMDVTGLRQMVFAPRTETPPDGDVQSRAAWRLEDIAAGLPGISAATSGLFTAQMLNLDLIGAVSFSKGCYTGQEIIARAHYLGQARRRMQRFCTDDAVELPPGIRVSLADGRRAHIVMASAAEGGGQEFLAITTVGTQPMQDEGDVAAGGAGLNVEQLALPYALSP
jgi:tRNA-modifying protein YgfZ